MAELSVGHVVTLTDGRPATVRFVGTTHFAAGDWIGVELDDCTGKNDGAVQGERYFECEPGFGMFIRPSAVAAIIEQPVRETKPPSKGNTNAAQASRARAQTGSTANSITMKRPGALPTTNVKRHSASAASTSPTSKSASQRTSTRVRTGPGAPLTMFIADIGQVQSPIKSPNKSTPTPAVPLSSTRGSISGPSSRPSTVASRSRPPSGARTSMPPPSAPSSAPRQSRPSISGPSSKATRPSLQSGTATAPGHFKRPALRPTASNKSSNETEVGTSGETEDPEIDLDVDDAEVDENEGSSRRLPEKTPGSARPAAGRPSLTSSSQRPAQNNSAPAGRDLDEIKMKLKVMEKKRAEDREKMKTLERLQSERDKFEAIIQKLQAKYQPQQLEIGDLRKKLKETEAKLEEVERLQAENDSILEMAALDREMAEETADAFRHECELLRARVEELQLELDILKEENEELGQTMSPEERSSHGWLQMEKTNERLREALIRLRDMTQQQESDLKDQIKELEQDLEDYATIKSQYESTKEKLLVSEDNVEDLKQQLETALGAEEMIEELADKNMRYQEEINELKAAIDDLEALKEVNDELEYNHIETEKQLQEEIDYREGLFNDQCRKISQQDEVIEDLEYTLVRFRELVSTLQGDLEDMRASQQISEAEANDLTTRSRAMIDLNMKLQASISKTQTKTIDIELARMSAEEDIQHLSIVKLYLPEYYEGERDSILALLRFKRVTFKASLIMNTIRENISEQASIATSPDDVFVAYDVFEKLLYISGLCDRFVTYITSCPTESFDSIRGALFEMEPVERTLNFWIEGLKKNEVNLRKCAIELQRSIALVSHLAETLLPDSLEAFADELCMRSSLTQSYMDHAASCMARLKSLLQSEIKIPEEGGDEECTFLLNKMDGFVSQARGLKVALGKVHRALEDLRLRSLSLSQDVAGPFKSTEEAARDLSALARQLGENIAQLIGEEARTEALTVAEALTTMSETSASYALPSETGSESKDTMSLLYSRLRSLTGSLEELDAVSSDLSITTEFERRPSPWIARAAELKSNKTISPDVDEEIRRLKNEIHEASTSLGVKDKTIEEQALRVELVESRMREANKKASMVKDLESKIEQLQAKGAELEGLLGQQRKDMQALEAEREDLKTRLERVKRLSGTTGVSTTTDGVVIDNSISLAAMRENEALRAEVESLQAAVRFLREENRRANMLDPYSVRRAAEMHSWLDVPLTKSFPTPQQDKAQQTASESKDVFAHLLKLTKDTSICDLKSTMSQDSGNRVGWRPSKAKLRYQVLQQREHYERWAEWKDDIVRHEREQDRLVATKKERVSRERSQRHVPRTLMHGEFLKGPGHAVMGTAWQMLGMDQHSRKPVEHPVEPSVAPSF
ncbi:putative dynactin [Aspergillus clavatus NRRL 1]|uniref:Dynactin, putative n=1 Tax=Aspergillus clavatus (strain ATCC 1007 / CBS 513.65 / DSM 816 / NCTC 3887 / NRRL 1 / QM 1276 / 107) TaxID=344612 RepID=A1C722_ASPCL|nr:dynactin, putative [Aspergillus clavatus NRRL 1]EAW14193.1 dynactin, putative [Aspergillus clavatus NRRL 1]